MKSVPDNKNMIPTIHVRVCVCVYVRAADSVQTVILSPQMQGPNIQPPFLATCTTHTHKHTHICTHTHTQRQDVHLCFSLTDSDFVALVNVMR